MTETELLQALDAWMFEQTDAEDMQLVIGVRNEWSWYAVLRKNGRQEGVAEHGSPSIRDALLALCKEIGAVLQDAS